MWARLKVNEIRTVIKGGLFNKGERSQKGGRGSFAVKHFTTVTKI